jgi:hypothetical protein
MTVREKAGIIAAMVIGTLHALLAGARALTRS